MFAPYVLIFTGMKGIKGINLLAAIKIYENL